MINNKISENAFKCMTVNLLLCILDAKSNVQEQAEYREKLGTSLDANIEMLAMLVRERKLLKNKAWEFSNTCGQYFQDAKSRTAYEMAQYWQNEYQYGQVLIDVEHVIQNNFNYVWAAAAADNE